MTSESRVKERHNNRFRNYPGDYEFQRRPNRLLLPSSHLSGLDILGC